MAKRVFSTTKNNMLLTNVKYLTKVKIKLKPTSLLYIWIEIATVNILPFLIDMYLCCYNLPGDLYHYSRNIELNVKNKNWI